MWKDYSADYIKNNRASGISIMVAAFIAALFLSFLCSLFYNFWMDNIQGVKLEDGDWHGRIAGEISEERLTAIRNFANVEKAVVNQNMSDGKRTVVDLCFYNKRTIYQDMSALLDMLGLTQEAADYNYQLLSLYFIRIPGDDMPRLLIPAYLAVVALVCVSLILVIHNAFAVSMNSRIHQFGIFVSIGATPGQIRACLLQEAVMLALAPILLGLLLGIALSYGTVRAMIAMAANLVGGREADFYLSPVILALVFLLSLFTVLVSAWLPARKLSRLTPLEAIRGTGELQLKRKRNSPVLAVLFGMEGELAGNALKAQKKALRTTSLSLTLAFLGFMLMQCFFTLSGISTKHTYFEAYQDVWDIMVTVKGIRIEDFTLLEELRRVPGADNIVVYQKAEALCLLPWEAQSQELQMQGGANALAGELVPTGEGFFLVKAPIVILDDESFARYCSQAGVASQNSGAILLNRFWDKSHSNFRNPEYIPYVQDGLGEVTLQSRTRLGEAGADSQAVIQVLGCTQECPVLREEYGKSDFSLVHFIPLSLWESMVGQIGGAQGEIYIRVLARDRDSLEALGALEEEIDRIVGQGYVVESENRIQEKLDNDRMIGAYELVLGAFCGLFAIIGIAHVFSNTLGFLRQRKREFARYMSVGLTPQGIRKMFCIEALLIAGRPMLITLCLTVAAVAVMIKASYLDPMEFIRVAPAGPIAAFTLAVFGFVALAYYLGGKKVLKVRLAEALRDDTML